MITQSSHKDKALINWLFVGAFLIFGMVIVGGITRLTGSGLSITEWKVVTGSIPPLSETQWQLEFDKYKQIPQYKLINYNFTLSDFKFIYFWEFTHRLFGRLIGIVFLMGYCYFHLKKRISKELRPKLHNMFLLGGVQGFLGWYMVSSGLTENIHVSHIRLAIHLIFAFITFGYIFKVALSQIYGNHKGLMRIDAKHYNATIVLFLLCIFQIIYGALVAGSKAGHIYNTWPKMMGEWMPESIAFSYVKDGIESLWYNLTTIQFIHRNMAYIIFAFTLALFIRSQRSLVLLKANKTSYQVLFIIIITQVCVGILTLLFGVPIWLGVLHQAIAFFIFGCIIYCLHLLKYE